MTKIILNEKKAAVFLISKFWTVKFLYSCMRQLYQMMNYINWLATSYTNMQLFFNLLQYYNCTCPNLSCLDIFMIRWWWTNSQLCNLALARRFWTTNICLWTSKILKYICLVAQLVEQLLEKQILKIILNFEKIFLIK